MRIKSISDGDHLYLQNLNSNCFRIHNKTIIKKMKNRNTLIMSGLLALTLGLGVSGTAFASQDFSKKSPGYSQIFDSQMTDVMTRVDYEGWRQLVLNKTGKVDPLITKDNFPKFAEAWRLAKEGKIKEANTIRK